MVVKQSYQRPAVMAVCSYMKVCLGGPTPAEHEALVAERDLLKKELSDARQQIEELKVRHAEGRTSTAQK